MRTLFAAASLFAATQAINLSSGVSSDEHQSFLEYLAEQGKSYNSNSDFNLRERLFLANQNWINAQNEASVSSGNPNSCQYGNNIFSDMTLRERLQRHGISNRFINWMRRRRQRRRGGSDEASEESESESSDDDSTGPVSPTDFDDNTDSDGNTVIPEETGLDWRARGFVNDVKNQGSCGSCWAFASVAQLESLYAIKHNSNIHSLSEQQLVDCATDGNNGCNGGFMSYAFDYYTSRHAMIQDANYPYTASAGNCKASQYDSTQVMTSGSSTIQDSWKASDWKTGLESGPISMAVAAGNNYWYNYQSGILDVDDCGSSIDHAVVMVGWGRDSATGQEYWIVRNSWGTSWGEGGYIRIAMKGSGDGVCLAQSLGVTVDVA